MIVKLLEALVDHLDIPKSYYEKARARHRSLGEWLCRPESKVAAFQPEVHLQGSFRYGTVNRPLLATEEYDLDNVTTLILAKTSMTQKQLKELYGAEVKAYAKAHGMLEPVEEKDRCWRLNYTDEVSFHLDTLPCVPEDEDVIAAIAARGVPVELAVLAVAITDRRHPHYEQISRALLSSNPRGFAAWFERCARPAALRRVQELVEARHYASVDDVPPYEWKTPLQRSIQILKRHRDVMFRDRREVAPISMIITNLAAHSYSGETDVWTALTNIVEKMPQYLSSTRPFVPNPANPAEDYADKWARDRSLEDNFWAWHAQAKADIARLPSLLTSRDLAPTVRGAFAVELTRDQLKELEPRGPAIVIERTAPALHIPAGPRPWGRRG